MTSSNPHYQVDNPPIEEKTSEGRQVIKIRSSGLNIVWGNDSRYWRLPNPNQMDMSAELLQVCWLEVTTCATTIKSGKKYQFGFSVSLTSDAFGWSGCPVYVMAKIGRKGKYTWKKVDLLGAAGRDKKEPFEIPDSFVLEIPSDVSPSEKELHFGLYEVWSGKWKGGLKIHHAFVREQ